MPLLCIMPTTQITPIFLTYTQSGAGHYDCPVPIPSNSIPGSKNAHTAEVAFAQLAVKRLPGIAAITFIMDRTAIIFVSRIRS